MYISSYNYIEVEYYQYIVLAVDLAHWEHALEMLHSYQLSCPFESRIKLCFIAWCA